MDVPRLLAKGGGSHDDPGYTSRPHHALTDEPEALSRDQLQDLEVRAERRRREQQLAEWQERRQLIVRELDWLNSQRFQRDVQTQVRALRRQLDRIDQRLDRNG